MSLMSAASFRLLPKPILALLAVAAVLGLSACGDSHTKVSGGTYAGESGANAPYLDVGPLVYEVQLSRELNPYDTEDSAYLEGLTPAQRRLAPGQEWFGVFMQVYNNGDKPQLAASALSMRITDTQNSVYLPTFLPASNPFAYRAGFVPAHGRVPELNTVAADGPTRAHCCSTRSGSSRWTTGP